MAAAASSHYNSPAGPLELLRYPRRRVETLQAWCAADTLLLEAALADGSPATETLIVNDEQGALTTALLPGMLWTDSALAVTAIEHNLERNQRPPVPVCWSTETPEGPHQLVVMRIPKQLRYFEYQLATVGAVMGQDALLLCGGMDKHLSPQTASLIEKYFGQVTRHRGRSKARLFSATRDASRVRAPAPPSRYYCEQLNCELASLANVFSGDALDIGSRFLIDNLHRIEPGQALADLACGNGVLGLCALQAGLGQSLMLCDESAMAIASARINAASLPFSNSIGFHLSDGFDGLPQKFDRILCNPPFHLGHAVDDFAGRRLLQQCVGQLQPGGQLYVVANRHLDYGALLKRQFSSVERLAQSNKFVIWAARTG